MKITAHEGWQFGDDPSGLLDMFFEDYDANELKQVRAWVRTAANKQRERSRVQNETRLIVLPESAEIRVCGRWDESWGEKRMPVGEFVALCDDLIARGWRL